MRGFSLQIIIDVTLTNLSRRIHFLSVVCPHRLNFVDQTQRRYDMRHEMLTQRAPFCIGAMAKKGTLSQHFVTHVVPPLDRTSFTRSCPL